MQFNKQIAIILVLVSFLLSAIAGAYYFYMENQKSIKSANQLILIYVAAKNIKKNTIIKETDIKQYKTARKFILSKKLLLKKEIVGKYATTDIFKNDSITREKISNKLVDDTEKEIIGDKFLFNSYNMKFSLFKNPNYSLKKGDIINIISVYPDSNGVAVQYVSKHIKVIGFLIKGEPNAKITKTTKVKKYNKKTKKTTYVSTTLKAEELLLDIDSRVLLSLITDYNKGRQLWMVKTKVPPIIKKEEKKEIKKIELINNSKKTKTIKRTYPFRLYKPKDAYSNIKATIHYADKEDAAVVEKKSIKIDLIKQCRDTDDYVLGISNNVHLRRGSSNKYKIIRIVRRNYIIPVKGKVNQNWYETCDGYFIHKNEVKKITKEQALRRMAKIK